MSLRFLARSTLTELTPTSLGLRSLSLSHHLNHSRTSRRWHGGHHHHHPHEGGERVFKLGFAADVALSVGKSLAGYLSGSTAIVADAAHSVSDVVFSGVALWSFKASRTPITREHPYGRGKFESLGALGISSMLVVSAGGIAWHAVDILYGLLTSSSNLFSHSLIHEHGNSHARGGHHHAIDLDHPLLALSVTVTSIAVKEWLYQITKRAGDKDGSGLMKANAWHHRADAVSSLVSLIGIGGAIVGVPFLDPLAGLLISGMILRAGVETGYQSVMELVDAGMPSTLLAPIKQTVLQVEGVKDCHHLRGRKAGSSLYLDIHIKVEPSLTVSGAHDIREKVRQYIHKSHNNVTEAYIQFDPFVSNTLTSEEKTSDGVENSDTDNINLKKCHIQKIVSDVISTKFHEMSTEHVALNLLQQGKFLLDVRVSMPPTLVIQDAMRVVKEAEVELLKADPSICQASILLRLGHRIPHIEGGGTKGSED